MAYIRPCNKCGQRISMREMRAGQWVAFDASTQTPHKCGKKTKADPKIKKLAKEKLKEKISEGVDLGYSNIEVKDPTPDKVEEINSKIEEIYNEAAEEIYETKKKKPVVKDEAIESQNYRETSYQPKKSEEKPRDFMWYFWRIAIPVWAFGIINWLLGCPFASCN